MIPIGVAAIVCAAFLVGWRTYWRARIELLETEAHSRTMAAEDDRASTIIEARKIAAENRTHALAILKELTGYSTREKLTHDDIGLMLRIAGTIVDGKADVVLIGDTEWLEKHG